ncbi:hypothetical protein GUITHDRAFT_144743 [Guillardia theta CCMP2712]|uniref:WW domain-containing protein n=1 Tax=Guillardia theta (strain CCMP2712) TaxID=905079 RepID=L1IPP9_GUITC|nr:hypothetical protein GUITHDRAFT_144743 [Guillardia theta CCMP2712]EKX37775.1 hypothetical protein GUITHDRAFT_144743 [Guillardia theta CCMP2712]|eukprot:XP_005824755.1 hypothetical protein GUITHDRAFT_144743 [Guillardia theta CCMP2712]
MTQNSGRADATHEISSNSESEESLDPDSGRSPAFLTPEESPATSEYQTPSSTRPPSARVQGWEEQERTGSVTETCTAPTFSKTSGKLVNHLTINIKCDEGDIIYYTTDGSKPSSSNDNATLYRNSQGCVIKKEMAVSGKITVRAKACNRMKRSSEVVEAVFQVLEPTMLVQAAAQASEQAKTLLSKARRMAFINDRDYQAVCAIALQMAYRQHLARVYFEQRKRAIIQIQSFMRQFISIWVVREMYEKRFRREADKNVGCLVVKLRLKGETVASLSESKKRIIFESAADAVKMPRGSWIVWKVEECLSSKYLKPHFEEDKQARIKESIACGQLERLMESKGLSCKTSYRERDPNKKVKQNTQNGWKRVASKTGEYFFWNKYSGERTWRVPDELAGVDLEEVPIAEKKYEVLEVTVNPEKNMSVESRVDSLLQVIGKGDNILRHNEDRLRVNGVQLKPVSHVSREKESNPAASASSCSPKLRDASSWQSSTHTCDGRSFCWRVRRKELRRKGGQGEGVEEKSR